MARPTTTGLALLFALVATLALAASASGSYQLLKVREVFPGTEDSGNDAFIELQMFAAGQTDVGEDKVCLRWYVQSDASNFESDCLDNDVANGENQRTILVGDVETTPEPDFTTEELSDMFFANNDLAGGFGAVCVYFPEDETAEPDCVSWGQFTGSDPLISPPPGNAGTPATPDSLPDGMSLTRSIARGCATLLEAGDDSDDSAADFAVTSPTPRPNSVSPTERSCPRRAFCAGVRATKIGGPGANVLTGTPRRDVIAGLGGPDTIRGLAGNDLLCGGKGRDRLIGGRGRDRLRGQLGRDICRGGAGRDRARGCEIRRTI